jgi:Flp pilus assembly protein TadG
MRTARKSGRLVRREDGQAYVEFALILPVLLLIVLGIIQFGNAFRTYIALTDATRVGARQASVSMSVAAPDRVPQIEQKMHEAAAGLDAAKMSITVTPQDTDGNQGVWEPSGQVTVRASYPFDVNLFGIVLFDSTINSRTTERVE